MLSVGCRSPSSETFSLIHKLPEVQFHSSKVNLDAQGFFGCPNNNLKKKIHFSYCFKLFSLEVLIDSPIYQLNAFMMKTVKLYFLVL